MRHTGTIARAGAVIKRIGLSSDRDEFEELDKLRLSTKYKTRNLTIDPEHSSFAQYWDVLVVAALIYTSTVTP